MSTSYLSNTGNQNAKSEQVKGAENLIKNS